MIFEKEMWQPWEIYKLSTSIPYDFGYKRENDIIEGDIMKVRAYFQFDYSIKMLTFNILTLTFHPHE